LAVQLAGLESHQKLLELPEGEPERQGRLLCLKAHHRHQDALGQGPVQGLPKEAEVFHAQEDPEGAGCEGGCYQLLMI
jgi:hypothetical protein